MTDRQPTQVLANGAIRYGIYRADGTLDHYEYLRREDAPAVEGTPLSKANLLSDATASKLWPGSNKPEDPTVNQAFEKLSTGMHAVGDIDLTSREAPSSAWLPCDGRYISQADYPELFNVLRVTASQGNWDTQVVDTNSKPDAAGDTISYANSTWFRTRVQYVSREEFYTAKMWYSSDDMNSWHKISVANNVHQLTPVHYYENKYVCIAIKYIPYSSGIRAHYTGYIYYASQPAGPWTIGGEVQQEIDSFVPGDSAEDIITDGTKYYLVEKEQYGMTSSLSLFPPAWQTSDFGGGTSSGSDSNTVENIAYNEADGYFYGAKGTHKYPSANQLARTRTPDDYNSWQVIYSEQGDYIGIAVEGNLILALGTGTAPRNYVYSVDGGKTFKTASLTTKPNVSPQRDWVKIVGGIAVLSTRTVVQEADSAPKLLYTDDLTQGFLSIDAPTDVNTFAGNGSGLIVGALKSQGASSVNIYRDFTYDAKKIPTITPDSRSHAYIKAVEE